MPYSLHECHLCLALWLVLPVSYLTEMSETNSPVDIPSYSLGFVSSHQ